MEAPRDNLTRSYDFELERADDGDGLTLTGYAAVFNSPTVIDSWEGQFEETIAPGAFRKTLRERTPVLQFDHGRHPMVGSIPLGSFTKLREDDRGLYVEARLHDNWLTQPVRDAISSESISGMSFRFSVIKDTWDHPKRGIAKRSIQEVSMAELGPVVFPAYTKTSVGVRAQEWVDVMMDPDARVELARALLIGTPLEGEPPSAEEPREHSGQNPDEPREHSEGPPHHDALRFALKAYAAR